MDGLRETAAISSLKAASRNDVSQRSYPAGRVTRYRPMKTRYTLLVSMWRSVETAKGGGSRRTGVWTMNWWESVHASMIRARPTAAIQAGRVWWPSLACWRL